jgi:hypothetical protein
MLLRRVDGGLLGARHLCGGSRHGCGQGGGSAHLADAVHSPSSPWISWTHGYYRKFIRGYGDIAAPLTQLLKRESFRWSSAAAAAFDALKNALTSASVLQLPDFDKSFVIDCDASGSGFGAVLHQGVGPLTFFSRAIAPHHAKLAAYERELIGLVKAVRHWRPYLWTRPFVVRIDHFSLKYLLDQRLSTTPQHTWVSKLFGYQLSVEFNPGRQNVAADALSRRHEDDVTVHSLSIHNFALLDEFRVEAAALPEVIAKRAELTAGTASPDWALVDDLVVRRDRLFLPTSASVWPMVLEHAHGMGHEGVQKTLHRLRASFTPGDNRLVRDFNHSCMVCQRNKTGHLHPTGLL